MAKEEEFAVDLTLHDFPASLLEEFAQNIVGPYYEGNLNAAVQDLVQKVLAEQEFVHSHVTWLKVGATVNLRLETFMLNRPRKPENKRHRLAFRQKISQAKRF